MSSQVRQNGPFNKPEVIGWVADANGNRILGLTPISNAVNSVGVQNAATGNTPILKAVGTDMNVDLDLEARGTGIVTVNGSDAVDYTTIPAFNQVLNPQIALYWAMLNGRKTVIPTFDPNYDGLTPACLNSGGSFAQYGVINFTHTGSTAASRCGYIWPKNTGPCPPGVGHYHYTYWPGPLYVSFYFSLATTLGAGTGVIGYFGNNCSNPAFNPTDLSWVTFFSGVGFKILSDGKFYVYVDNQDASTHDLHLTGYTFDVTGVAEPIVNQVSFAIHNGTVDVFVANGGNRLQHIATYTGMQNTESATDNYPFIVCLNEPSGTAADYSFLVYPIEIAVG